MTANLAGLTVLIVEDQPLIALDLAEGFRSAGASALPVYRLADALPLAERDNISGAVLDSALADGDTAGLCERLAARGIPFVIHSGYEQKPRPGGAVVPKPANVSEVVEALVGLLNAQSKM